MKAYGIKHDGKAAKTALAAAVDVLGAAGERGMRDTEPPLPDPGPGPLPSPLLGDPVLDPGVDDDIFEQKGSWFLLNFNLNFRKNNTHRLRFLFNQLLFLFLTSSFQERNEILLIWVDLRATVRKGNHLELMFYHLPFTSSWRLRIRQFYVLPKNKKRRKSELHYPTLVTIFVTIVCFDFLARVFCFYYFE